MPHATFHLFTIAKSPRLAVELMSALIISASRMRNLLKYALNSQIPNALNTCAMMDVYTVKNR